MNAGNRGVPGGYRSSQSVQEECRESQKAGRAAGGGDAAQHAVSSRADGGDAAGSKPLTLYCTPKLCPDSASSTSNPESYTSNLSTGHLPAAGCRGAILGADKGLEGGHEEARGGTSGL